MSDHDPFTNTNSNTNTPPTEGAQGDPFADQLKSITDGEGKPKYQDTATALKALDSSQSHIKTLESEGATAREEIERLKAEVAKREAVEDVVSRLTQNQVVPPKGETSPDANQLDETKVMELIKKTFTLNEQQTVAQSNRNAVLNQLAEKFGVGEALNKAVASRATELGTTPQAIGKMAEQNPKLVLELFGEKIKVNQSPAQGSTNVSVTTPKDEKPLKFERSIARGGHSTKEVMDMFQASKEATNKRLGIE